MTGQRAVQRVIVVGAIVAAVEALASAETSAGACRSIVLIRGPLVRHCVPNRRNLAVAALVVAAKRHDGDDGDDADGADGADGARGGRAR